MSYWVNGKAGVEGRFDLVNTDGYFFEIKPDTPTGRDAGHALVERRMNDIQFRGARFRTKLAGFNVRDLQAGLTDEYNAGNVRSLSVGGAIKIDARGFESSLVVYTFDIKGVPPGSYRPTEVPEDYDPESVDDRVDYPAETKSTAERLAESVNSVLGTALTAGEVVVIGGTIYVAVTSAAEAGEVVALAAAA